MSVFSTGIKLLSVLGVIGVVYLVLWLWCLFDVTRRQFGKPKAKKAWLWAIILMWPVSFGIGFIPVVSVLAPILGICGLIVFIYYLIAARYRHSVSVPRITK